MNIKPPGTRFHFETTSPVGGVALTGTVMHWTNLYQGANVYRVIIDGWTNGTQGVSLSTEERPGVALTWL